MLKSDNHPLIVLEDSNYKSVPTPIGMEDSCSECVGSFNKFELCKRLPACSKNGIEHHIHFIAIP
jgi:hypothetical protein